MCTCISFYAWWFLLTYESTQVLFVHVYLVCTCVFELASFYAFLWVLWWNICLYNTCYIHVEYNEYPHTSPISAHVSIEGECTNVCMCITCVCSSLWVSACTMHVCCNMNFHMILNVRFTCTTYLPGWKLCVPPKTKKISKWKTALVGCKACAPFGYSRLHSLFFSTSYNLILPGQFEEFLLQVLSSSLWKNSYPAFTKTKFQQRFC